LAETEPTGERPAVRPEHREVTAVGPSEGVVEPIEAPPGPEVEAEAGDEGAVMSLVDHLTELRRRLIVSVLAVVAGSIVGLFVTPRVIQLLIAPIHAPLRFTTLGGAFFVQLKLAFMIGVAIAFPVILYQLWAFVAPGLTSRERRTARPWIPLALVFFVLGIGVAYLALPYTAAFLLSFQIADVLEPLITAEEYFNFVTLMFLAFGVVMEFPILLVLLSKLGLVSVERLRSIRRYVLLGTVIFAVLITPGGDPVSPAILTAVMYTLYELTILLLSRPAQRRDERSVVASDG
jgi:sec-independent protein translocase protein TatC